MLSLKNKVIDIMNMFANHHDVNYTLNNNCASVVCSPEIFAQLLHTIATRNIDILSASYRAKMLHKAKFHNNLKTSVVNSTGFDLIKHLKKI